jgi:hypothetical protein
VKLTTRQTALNAAVVEHDIAAPRRPITGRSALTRPSQIAPMLLATGNPPLGRVRYSRLRDLRCEVSNMVKVGDRIALSSFKGADREGVVTEVTGAMVRVRWSSGQESAVVPAPGTLTVRESADAQANRAVGSESAPPNKTPSGAGVKKAAAKAATKKPTPKGASGTAARSKSAATKANTSTSKGSAKRPG